jgi:DNA repair exonuclease SbcCD ATPase subunit
LEAPDDVFVQELAPDGTVQVNQVLMTLRSPNLERFQSRLTMLQKHMEIVERPLNDGRIDEAIKSLKDKAAALEAAKAAMDEEVAGTQWKYNHGEIADKLQVNDVVIKSASDVNIYADIILQASQADKNLQDMKERLEAAKDHLMRDVEFLDKMQKSMTIVATAQGEFTGHVMIGSFARKGHILGVLSI